MSVVDQETDLRMSRGFFAKFGEDWDNEDRKRFYNLSSLCFDKGMGKKMNPLVNTFTEIDTQIQKISRKWKPIKRYAKSKARKA